MVKNGCQVKSRCKNLMWQSGQLTNLQIAEKFGLTYSAVSRRVGVFKDLLGNSTTLHKKFNRIKSLIKI